MQKKVEAEEAGSGMGLASGILAYAMGLIKAAEKIADAHTKPACVSRLATMKVEHTELQLLLKNVYYEKDASVKDD